MIVSVLDDEGRVEALYEDVRCVVHEGGGWLRIFRDGHDDVDVENRRIVVT